MNEGFLTIEQVNVKYGKVQALHDVDLAIPANSIYSFIGPSGCGKTTLLRSVNRLNDFVPSFSLTGSVALDGEQIYATDNKRKIEELRAKIGMVFQQANPLPTTIMNNLLFPLREHYRREPRLMKEAAVEKLRMVGLYDEVADRLDRSALSLSGGQQQRLCIARALMLDVKLLLLDEPCSALDPISTYKIEELLLELKKFLTVVIVTHNMEQASRISDYTAFFYQGHVVEKNTTAALFASPKEEATQYYITGRM